MENSPQFSQARQSRATPLLKGRYFEGMNSPIQSIWSYDDGRHRVVFANGQTMMARPGLIKSYVDKQLQAAEANKESISSTIKGGVSRLIPPSNSKSHARFPTITRTTGDLHKRMINGSLWQ